MTIDKLIKICYNKTGREKGAINMRIYFDMDGTIANFYGVEGWLNYIINEDTFPYANAKPLINMQRLARRLNMLQERGCEIGVISWLAKGSTPEYDERVAEAKRRWLAKHLTSVQFDEIIIVKYGTPKHTLGSGILFDDEKPNRDNWGKSAYTPEEIFEVLKELA